MLLSKLKPRGVQEIMTTIVCGKNDSTAANTWVVLERITRAGAVPQKPELDDTFVVRLTAGGKKVSHRFSWYHASSALPSMDEDSQPSLDA
jgi:hypothetical protein